MPKLVYVAHPLHAGGRIVKDNRERLLRLCHEAWFFDSSPWVEDGRPWQESPGCMTEYNLAREWHIPCAEMAFERGRIWLKVPHLRSGSTPRGQIA